MSTSYNIQSSEKHHSKMTSKIDDLSALPQIPDKPNIILKED